MKYVKIWKHTLIIIFIFASLNINASESRIDQLGFYNGDLPDIEADTLLNPAFGYNFKYFGFSISPTYGHLPFVDDNGGYYDVNGGNDTFGGSDTFRIKTNIFIPFNEKIGNYISINPIYSNFDYQDGITESILLIDLKYGIWWKLTTSLSIGVGIDYYSEKIPVIDDGRLFPVRQNNHFSPKIGFLVNLPNNWIISYAVMKNFGEPENSQIAFNTYYYPIIIDNSLFNNFNQGYNHSVIVRKEFNNTMGIATNFNIYHDETPSLGLRPGIMFYSAVGFINFLSGLKYYNSSNLNDNTYNDGILLVLGSEIKVEKWAILRIGMKMYLYDSRDPLIAGNERINRFLLNPVLCGGILINIQKNMNIEITLDEINLDSNESYYGYKDIIGEITLHLNYNIP